jgi:uncharacterized iron-regulated membrane protein
MSPAVRKSLLALHQWAGLILGLVLVVVSVSGAALVFRTQLERRVAAAMFVVEPRDSRLSADVLVARARAAQPAAELVGVHFHGDPTMPDLAYFSNRSYVHLDPYTGEVIGTRLRYGEGFGWVEGLHKYLLFEPDRLGETVAGYTALTFILITLTGVVLWWPATRRALKAGLTLNWKLTGRPWNLGLHKTLGVYAAGVVLASALTGVPMALDWAKRGLYIVTGSDRPQSPMPAGRPGDTTFAGFDVALRSVLSHFPGAQQIYVPAPRKGVIPAYVIEAGAAHPNARSLVWLEPATGGILKATRYTEAGAGHRLYYWMMSLHTGALGGPVVQIILLLGVLTVPALVYTGAASYLRRNRRRVAAVSPTADLVVR